MKRSCHDDEAQWSENENYCEDWSHQALPRYGLQTHPPGSDHSHCLGRLAPQLLQTCQGQDYLVRSRLPHSFPRLEESFENQNEE